MWARASLNASEVLLDGNLRGSHEKGFPNRYAMKRQLIIATLMIIQATSQAIVSGRNGDENHAMDRMTMTRASRTSGRVGSGDRSSAQGRDGRAPIVVARAVQESNKNYERQTSSPNTPQIATEFEAPNQARVRLQ
jgi:hypothetical protein